MQTDQICVNLGQGLTGKKFTIDYTDLTATAATSKAQALWTLPAGAKITAVNIYHTTAFAGTSITAMTVSVGKSGTATHFTATLDIFAAVADSGVLETAMFKSGQKTALPVIATFTATGANLTALTAGQVVIEVYYVNPNTL